MSKLIQLHERHGIKSDGLLIQEWVTVDDEDLDWLTAKGPWYYKVDNANSEARHVSIGRDPVAADHRHRKSSLVLMNREILGIDLPCILVHYKDGNVLNMQKENLYIHINGHRVRQLRQHWMEATRIIVEEDFRR